MANLEISGAQGALGGTNLVGNVDGSVGQAQDQITNAKLDLGPNTSGLSAENITAPDSEHGFVSPEELLVAENFRIRAELKHQMLVRVDLVLTLFILVKDKIMSSKLFSFTDKTLLIHQAANWPDFDEIAVNEPKEPDDEKSAILAMVVNVRKNIQRLVGSIEYQVDNGFITQQEGDELLEALTSILPKPAPQEITD